MIIFRIDGGHSELLYGGVEMMMNGMEGDAVQDHYFPGFWLCFSDTCLLFTEPPLPPFFLDQNASYGRICNDSDKHRMVCSPKSGVVKLITWKYLHKLYCNHITINNYILNSQFLQNQHISLNMNNSNPNQIQTKQNTRAGKNMYILWKRRSM
jgi:hypothetical protein